jgi:hypothetical protein
MDTRSLIYGQGGTGRARQMLPPENLVDCGLLFRSSPDDSTSCGVLLIPQCSPLLPSCLPGSLFRPARHHRLHYTSVEKLTVDLLRLITNLTHLRRRHLVSGPQRGVQSQGVDPWLPAMERVCRSGQLQHPAQEPR